MTTRELLGNLGLSVDDVNHPERATSMSYQGNSRYERDALADVKASLEGSIAALERELAEIHRLNTIVHELFQKNVLGKCMFRKKLSAS